MKNTHKGFTLIELLVVIAIIGVLAAVVVPNLNSVRLRGNDTAIEMDISQIRTQAELYYDSNYNSYAGLCGSAKVGEMLLAAEMAWGTTTVPINTALGTAGSFDTATCHDTALGYAAEGPLKASASGVPLMWCVDSTGTSSAKTTNIAAGAVVCQ